MCRFNGFWLFLVLLLASCASTPENQSRRDKWIQKTLVELKSFKPGPDTHRVKPVKSDRGLSYTIGHRSLLEDVDGNWVYFIAHSSHSDSAGIPNEDCTMVIAVDNIGDITLAVDNKGVIYQSNRHVCGAIQRGFVRSDNLKGFKNAHAFVSGWKRVK